MSPKTSPITSHSEEWIAVVTEMLVMMPEWLSLEKGNVPNGWKFAFHYVFVFVTTNLIYREK